MVAVHVEAQRYDAFTNIPLHAESSDKDNHLQVWAVGPGGPACMAHIAILEAMALASTQFRALARATRPRVASRQASSGPRNTWGSVDTALLASSRDGLHDRLGSRQRHQKSG